MKIEFPVLESEPLIYFLLHSGVFVFALAAVFFILGICMGAAIWGRYKAQLQSMKLENAGQLQEIAVLKRKLAEQVMRPSNAAPPPTTLLTEVLPSVGEIFPERSKVPHPPVPPTIPAPAASQIPAPAQTPATPPPAQPAKAPPKPPAAPVFAPAPEAAPLISLTPTPAPLVPVADAEAHADPEVPTTAQALMPVPEKRPRRSTVRVKPRRDPVVSAPAVMPGAEEDELTPFGFLLADPADAPAPSVSALAAIIQTPAVEPRAAPVEAPTLLEVPEPEVVPLLEAAPVVLAAPIEPVPELPPVLPEVDPALGLVYKSLPPDADDLTRIKGIASVLEKRLHELGIYTWRQIASWEDSHIREFSSRLAFKDRIVREKWVEQARTLNEARQSE